MPTPEQKMTPEQKLELRRASVAKFASRVGEREQPPTPNRCELADAANAYVGNPPGSAYCCASSTYCLGMAAAQMGLSLADTTIIKTGYCPTAYQHAKANGTAIDPRDVVSGRATILPGDFVLVFEPGEDGDLLPHHCETVEIAPGKGAAGFVTIGANTIPDGWTGDESQGIGVFRKRRYALDMNPDGHNRYVFIRTV